VAQKPADESAGESAGELGPAVPEGVIVLDASVLATAPVALRTRALLFAVREVGAPPGAVSQTQVRAVDALVSAWHGQGAVALPGRFTARRTHGAILLEPPGCGTLGTPVDP
jgi:tRNA(Ile)-lysidine synthase